MDTRRRSSTTSRRKYGFSCLSCRRRKIRCDGKKPTCEVCTRSGESCAYTANDATLSRISNALYRSEARIAELQEALRSSPRGQEGPEAHQSAFSESAGQTSLSIDENGTVQYYGATSRFHVAPARRLPSPEVRAKETVDEAYHRKWLLSNARFQKSWDRALYVNLRVSTDIDAEAASTLLQIYWTWQAPLHNCVYRRCFTRDMALGGPYFSPFLINVIYAHACRHAKPDDHRFTRYNRGEVFLEKAKLLLLEEIEQERPRIPTIQGLLILGGRQCAVGKNSQGWLYTGMAIQMLKHLGFHLPKGQGILLENLEPDDLEARKRLYFSAYAWDKSISLTLGRLPSLPDMPYPPMSLFDTSDDAEDWYPFYLGDQEGENRYTPAPSYNTTTFSYFCEQSKVLNEMYHAIYNRRSEHIQDEIICSLERKLRGFYQDLPDEIRVDNVESLPSCPPPHIFSLNILYHTSLILLYRPFFRVPSAASPIEPEEPLLRLAREVCTEEAAKVNSFFRAYGSSFWFRNQTYLTSYCVYTAATIEVQQVRHPEPAISAAAAERLATTLRMLEVESIQTPGIRRSVDIIKAQLEPQATRDVVQAPHLATRNKAAQGGEMQRVGPMTITALVDGGLANFGGRYLATEVSEGGLPALGASTLASADPAVPSALAAGYVSEFGTDLMGNNLLPSSWLDWYAPDASGGFVPDADGWDITGH